jgi:ferritin-like metal-binding protein YciE
MAKEPKKLEELFHDTLKDIYFAERWRCEGRRPRRNGQ